MSEQLDFSLVLVLVLLASLLIWLWIATCSPPARARSGGRRRRCGRPGVPVTVDYARSFLPVAALVLALRAVRVRTVPHPL